MFGLAETLVPTPLRVSWSLRVRDADKAADIDYDLPLPGGKATLRNVTCYFATVSGGATVVKDIELAYSVPDLGMGLSLQALAGDGCYYVTVLAKVLDYAGNPVRGPHGEQPIGLGLGEIILDRVFIEGDYLEIGGGYQQDFQECQMRLRAALNWATERIRSTTLARVPNIWQPVDMPDPGLIWQNITDTIIAVGSHPDVQVSGEYVQQVIAAHGSAYSRFMAAKVSGLLTAPLGVSRTGFAGQAVVRGGAAGG